MKFHLFLPILLVLAVPLATVAHAEDPLPGPTPRGAKKSGSRLTNDESEENADRRSLLLSVGEDRTVDLEFVFNSANGLSIGNPKILAATLAKFPDRSQIVFKPLAEGETTVSVRDEDGTIRLIFSVRITKSNLERLADQIRELTRDIEGVQVKIIGQKIAVDGELLVPSDYGRLVTVIGDKAYRDTVINLTTLSPLGLQVMAKRMGDDIRAFAPNVTVRVVNGVIFLEGSVEAAHIADRAMKIATTYLPEVKPVEQVESDVRGAPQRLARRPVENFIVVQAPPQKREFKLVRVTVHFVELSKDYNKVFGFKWQPGFTPNSDSLTIGAGTAGGATAGGTNGSSFTATLSSLFPRLSSAQAAGYARILKSSTVIVKGGQPASVTENTQFPYFVQQANGQQSSESVPVGIAVGVTPLILGDGNDLQLTLKLKQSTLVSRGATGSKPVTANHEVETMIYVKSGESAAVAGVHSSDVGTDFNKDDNNAGSYGSSGGARTDPLFNLLHSKNYRKKKSQFVIFVTPQVIESASEGTKDLERNFRVKVK